MDETFMSHMNSNHERMMEELQKRQMEYEAEQLRREYLDRGRWADEKNAPPGMSLMMQEQKRSWEHSYRNHDYRFLRMEETIIGLSKRLAAAEKEISELKKSRMHDIDNFSIFEVMDGSK